MDVTVGFRGFWEVLEFQFLGFRLLLNRALCVEVPFKPKASIVVPFWGYL